MRSLLEKKWFVYTAGLAFFFVLFRYFGYYEDAGRYLLQTVHFLHPERFANDVPFMFGNQDSFTIFSPLLLLFFKMFGVNHGGIVAVLLIEFLWGLAAITLFVRWTKMWGHLTWALPTFIACLVILTNKQYGSGAYFPIIDHILVARFAAEVFILLGLAFLWSRNRYVSLVMFLLASVLHPLMGGWGIPLWLLFHYPVLRLPMAIVVVLAPLTGFLHMGRLDFFPSDWFGERLPFTPAGEDAIFYAGVLIFWWVVWKFCKNLAISKFASAIFWLSLFGIFWLYVGIFIRHELLVQVQPYRVLWLGFVPTVPVSVLCVWDYFRKPTAISLCLNAKPKPVFTIFVFALAFCVASVSLHNMVQLAMEQDVGNVEFARNLMDLPAVLAPAHKVVLSVLALICLAESRFGLAIAFGLSFFNGDLTILPIIAIILYLFPSIQGLLKGFLIVAAIIISLAEYLSGLQASPLLGPGAHSSIFLVVLFILVGLITYLYKSHRENVLWIPFLLMIVTLVVWDVAKWDVRNESRVLDEQQMDAFFDQTAFPQIKDRGKILFVEKGETPLQSRFKFLTGTYADETINIGELFYKGQFLEARRRKNALLLGDSVLGDWGNYTRRIAEVYANPDTLLTRVNFLCNIDDITHFVTDYEGMSLPKQDSLYLSMKNKYVYLYRCF